MPTMDGSLSKAGDKRSSKLHGHVWNLYRIFLTDVIAFDSSMIATLEHGSAHFATDIVVTARQNGKQMFRSCPYR